MIRYLLRSFTSRSPLQKTLREYFGSVTLGEIVTAARDFPITSRVDVQRHSNSCLGKRPAQGFWESTRRWGGRVISLESHQDYSGRGGAVKVHRLHKVNREDVILQQKTLTLLDRNVGRFVAARDYIKKLQFSAKAASWSRRR